MEPSEQPRRSGASGGAGIVAGLLLVGLLIMGLAAGVFFFANAQQQAEFEVLQREEREKRVVAEQHEAAAKARADAEHERALVAEQARAAHEAAQIEALHREEQTRGGGLRPSGSGGPPGIKVGTKLVFFQGEKRLNAEVSALVGAWVKVQGHGGSSYWVNFTRVDRYEIVSE